MRLGECEKKVNLKVLFYLGKIKEAFDDDSSKTFDDYDVVIATYDTLRI